MSYTTTPTAATAHAELIRQYVSETRLVSHQILAYDDFVQRGLQRIVERDSHVRLGDSGHTIVKFDNARVGHPIKQTCSKLSEKIYPNDCRKNHATYEGDVYVDVVVARGNERETRFNRVGLGKIPIMVGSSRCNLDEQNKTAEYECPNDPGGYFIINGKERVLVSQMRPTHNKVYVLKSSDKYELVAETRTMNPSGGSVLIRAKIDAEGKTFLSLPYIKDHLEPGLVFRAMGVEWDDVEKALYANRRADLDDYFDQYAAYGSSQEAVAKIAESLPDKDPVAAAVVVSSILRYEMFCHLGDNEPTKCVAHLGHLLKKLVSTWIGERSIDDKDSLTNKRLDTADSLLAFLFQSLYKQFIKNLKTTAGSKKITPRDALTMIKSCGNFTAKIVACFTTGTWDVQKGSSYTRIAVSQPLSRQNYGAFLSHLRRIMLPIGNKGKIVKMRQLHASQYGYICPYETPEGYQVGVVLNLALTADVTRETPVDTLMACLRDIEGFGDVDVGAGATILINGVIVGTCADEYAFYNAFCDLRNSDSVDDTVSIVRLKREREIHLYCDQGRLIRPLFRVKNNVVLYTGESWAEAVANKSIVFREPAELERSVVAVSSKDLRLNKCDYMEISPALTLPGVMAAVVPFYNHSQSPRIAYQACMGKQAIGIPSLAARYRYDTTLHVLDTPQRPLTKSAAVDILKFDEMSHGCVPIVAVMCYTGFNQEDGFLINKASVDRGMFRATTYKTITEEAKKRGNADFETISLPRAEIRRREYDYSPLDENGLARVGSVVKEGDVLIGKTINKTVKGGQLETTDASVIAKESDEGIVDSAVVKTAPDGTKIVRVKIRSTRIPQIGDKFASSCAQKGTCGLLVAQEDMPVDAHGMTPDIIMNPHAIPSRMTINMLIEMAYNLVSVKTGESFDATAFAHGDVSSDLLRLSSLINERDNSERDESDPADGEVEKGFATTMYCGTTGKRYPTRVFMGPAFFQRLKHMVKDKIYARRHGPLDTLTHQPTAGRRNGGGLRTGEMERDTLIVHGCSQFLKEALFYNSDAFTIPICSSCGSVPHNLYSCHCCEKRRAVAEATKGTSAASVPVARVTTKNLPYAAKLLFYQFMAMGIRVRFS